MPFKEGPRRAEKDQDGNPTYTCTWEGESLTLSLSRVTVEVASAEIRGFPRMSSGCGCL